MNLDIEFARRGFWQQRGARLFLLGVSCATLTTIVAIGGYASNQHLATKAARLHQESASKMPVLVVRTSADPEKSKRLASAIRELGIPWSAAFQSIENAHTASITLLGIEPDPQSASIRISGLAQSYTEALGFADRLSRRPPLFDVMMMSHQSNGTGPDAPVRFVLSARWVLS